MPSTISKQKVVEEATRAFRDLGPTCSVSEVAHRLGVPRRRMYRHFECSFDLKNAVSEEHIRCIKALRVPDRPLKHRFRQLFDIVFDVEMCDITRTGEHMDAYLGARESTFLALLEEGRNHRIIEAPSDGSAAAAFCFHVIESHVVKELHLEFSSDGRTRSYRLDLATQQERSSASIERFHELFERVLGITTFERISDADSNGGRIARRRCDVSSERETHPQ